MNSIASGIDLVEIDRFRSIDPKIRARFLKRVFTVEELKSAANENTHLAGKFAAKEAAAKALGCGIGVVSWQDLEILSDNLGRPILILHGPAIMRANEAGWIHCSISISHTSTHAVASATALIELPDLH